MYRIDRLYRHLEFSLALPLIVTKLTRIATYAFFLVHWVSDTYAASVWLWCCGYPTEAAVGTTLARTGLFELDCVAV
jgi:hypothetical protein